jgi:hypothetical protein
MNNRLYYCQLLKQLNNNEPKWWKYAHEFFLMGLHFETQEITRQYTSHKIRKLQLEYSFQIRKLT